MLIEISITFLICLLLPCTSSRTLEIAMYAPVLLLSFWSKATLFRLSILFSSCPERRIVKVHSLFRTQIKYFPNTLSSIDSTRPIYVNSQEFTLFCRNGAQLAGSVSIDKRASVFCSFPQVLFARIVRNKRICWNWK